MPVVEIENLSKDFSTGFWKKHSVRALDNLCLQVNEGEIFGFLGPNGAGKSTTLKLLMNLLSPTSGTARILGKPITDTSMRQSIGYLPENPYFYDYLTPRELLTYIGRLFGMHQPELSRRVTGLLDDVGLNHVPNVQLRKFSKGMVQRLGIAQAIINHPGIVFLDEPMSGLDPLGRMEVRRIITSLKARGATVFFSSHILPDVEAICDRVAILNRGRLREAGALDEILKVGIEGHEVIVSGWTEETLTTFGDCCDELLPMGERLRLRVDTREKLETLLLFIFTRKLELISVSPIRPSLEEYFQTAVNGRQPNAAA
jgi:ABC-2 type transport system ATP-binding protein